MRVGIGYDSHRFSAERPLVLAGVTIPGHAGLAGHSDADLIAHAVTDALLGAAGLGDIGSHFPPGDERWRGADSLELLRLALQEVEAHSYQVVNVDVTVVCETPRLGPYVEAMRTRLGDLLGIGAGHVSIKGKSNEGMGWIGRGEGAAAIAVALIDRLPE
jgi:2-C-methyl-D-erythritol 2,4-cyclodiphosphate synthase